MGLVNAWFRERRPPARYIADPSIILILKATASIFTPITRVEEPRSPTGAVTAHLCPGLEMIFPWDGVDLR